MFGIHHAFLNVKLRASVSYRKKGKKDNVKKYKKKLFCKK